MKIYTFLAEAQKFMYENYFLSSLPKDFEPHATIHTEPYVDFGVTPFSERTRSKLHFMAKACEENFGEIIVFSDADVQFFGPIKKILIEELDDFDIACQQGGIFTYFSLCPGFFVCKCNDMTLKLFDNMKKFFRTDDQFSLNEQKRICSTNEQISLIGMVNSFFVKKINFVFFVKNLSQCFCLVLKLLYLKWK